MGTSETMARAFRSYNEQVSAILNNQSFEYRTARNTVWTANDLTWEAPLEEGSN